MEVVQQFDVAVIGGGPAGCAAAITAAREGRSVVLFEQSSFPRQKVCGEFVSGEAAGVMQSLLGPASDELLHTIRIHRARLWSGGIESSMRVEPAAYSVTRYALDNQLWKAASESGAVCVPEGVTALRRAGRVFDISTATRTFRVSASINASGRWSRLSRRIPANGKAYVGLKAHFRGTIPDEVQLHFFRGGYCGVQPVAEGMINVCALVESGGITSLQDVLSATPELRALRDCSSPAMSPIATAPVYPQMPVPVQDGMLQAGDAAGFVDPFVGDGISLALRGGALAGRLCMEEPEAYASAYLHSFESVYRSSLRLRTLLQNNAMQKVGVCAMNIPAIARFVFQSTRIGR